MKLLDGGNRRPPAPRPRLTGPRTAQVSGDAVMKIINGTRVMFYGPVVVFVDLRRR